MKNILTISLLLVTFNVMGQITLEHKYDSASTIATAEEDQLLIIKFEVSGERYAYILSGMIKKQKRIY